MKKRAHLSKSRVTANLYYFRPKPTAPTEPVKEAPKEPKKEQTKNVSFKNHLDYTSPPSSKAVPEKDQLAKLPYGWSAEVRLTLKSFFTRFLNLYLSVPIAYSLLISSPMYSSRTRYIIVPQC